MNKDMLFTLLIRYTAGVSTSRHFLKSIIDEYGDEAPIELLEAYTALYSCIDKVQKVVEGEE